MGQQQSSPSVPVIPGVEPPKASVSACPMKSKETTSTECKDCVTNKTTAPATEQAVKSECPMRGKTSPEAKTVTTQEPEKSRCPMKGKSTTTEPAAASGGGCPMKTKKEDPKPVEVVAPVAAAPVAAPAAGGSACPVKGGDKYINPNVYNVYNQKIDPTNQMPATANQVAAPDQVVDLSKERISSSIPKGGTESTWLYPSPQMFWNALVRKNKTEGAAEEDMEDVVRIHNNMNENTWRQILEWEKLHAIQGPGREPKLLRFLGRPQDFSPKAQLKMLLGHVAPFDRHDWFVDRGGEEVRYVIDYYHDEAGAGLDKSPENKSDFNSIKSIKIDVRPALDSPQSILDRVMVMPYHLFTKQTRFKPLPFLPPNETVLAEQRQKLQLQEMWQLIRTNCDLERNKLINCQNEKDCANATIALQRCTASVACPSIAQAFDAAVQAEPFDAEKADRSYQSIMKCLDLFEADSKKAFAKK